MLATLQEFWFFITHLNVTLPLFITAHGDLVYALLFAIIFIETGLVVMPFLPGDSLLFVAGSLAAGANPSLDLAALFGLLFLAAVLGDNINYWVGRFFGPRVVKWRLFGRDLVQQEHLDKTHGYFEKYGVKTIIIARFVPIVRTITPFVAGVGAMDYRRKFLPFDVLGGGLWIALLLLAGFAFGTHPWVQKHYEAVILGIVFISVLPMAVEFIRHRASRPGNTSKA
ncbi:MAG TPA: VTT domain-containing protein [Flavobacteriales bacterium]|nr:VTT domain-containing protein [Flavobacteriales bacterium]